MTQPPSSPFGGPNPVDGPAPRNPGPPPAPPVPPPVPQWSGPPHAGWQGPLQPGFAPPTPPPRNKKAVFVTVGATLAVLLVVGIVVAIVAFSGGGSEDNAGGGGASTAGEAVKGYLEALSRGDANAALAFGSDQPASRDFLTDDILKQQIARWPITNIRILSANETAGFGQVHVAVNFGDQASDQTLMVRKGEDGWKLSAAAVKLNLKGSMPTSDPVTGRPVPPPPVTLFGKPAANMSTVYVFPGWLDLGSSSTYLTVSAARPVLLDGLLAQGVAMPTGVQFQLSDAGSEAAKQAVAAAVTACAQSTALSPPGCPNQMPNPTLVDGTARWEAPADLNEIQYTFTAFDMTVRTTAMTQWTLTATNTGGETVQGKPMVALMGQIDMTQDPLTVKWYGR